MNYTLVVTISRYLQVEELIANKKMTLNANVSYMAITSIMEIAGS